jgi:hypothetical protein
MWLWWSAAGGVWCWGVDHHHRAAINSPHPQEPWTLHDGPPYANGDLHIGHALNKVRAFHCAGLPAPRWTACEAAVDRQ